MACTSADPDRSDFEATRGLLEGNPHPITLPACPPPSPDCMPALAKLTHTTVARLQVAVTPSDVAAFASQPLRQHLSGVVFEPAATSIASADIDGAPRSLPFSPQSEGGHLAQKTVRKLRGDYAAYIEQIQLPAVPHMAFLRAERLSAAQVDHAASEVRSLLAALRTQMAADKEVVADVSRAMIRECDPARITAPRDRTAHELLLLRLLSGDASVPTHECVAHGVAPSLSRPCWAHPM